MNVVEEIHTRSPFLNAPGHYPKKNKGLTQILNAPLTIIAILIVYDRVQILQAQSQQKQHIGLGSLQAIQKLEFITCCVEI